MPYINSVNWVIIEQDNGSATLNGGPYMILIDGLWAMYFA